MHGLRRISLIVVLLLLVVLAGCGGGSDDEPTQMSSPQRQSTENIALTEANDDTAATVIDADGDGLMTMEEYVVAVDAAFSTYRWPEGYTPTVATMMQSLENAPPGEHLFQVGLEHTKLGVWHECAWYMAWLDAFQRGDEATQAEVLQVMLEEIPANPSLDPALAEALIEVAESAALGDPSRVTQEVEAGCGGMMFDGPA
jgi:hypothetical protein